MQRAKGTEPHSEIIFSVWESSSLVSVSPTFERRTLIASCKGREFNRMVLMFESLLGASTIFLDVVIKVRFWLDKVLISRKMSTNCFRSSDSRTRSALSSINVTFLDCCLLQFRSQCLGCSGGWERPLLQVRIILVNMSFSDDWNVSEQYNTLRLFSRLASSWATLLAIVVFPKPGPPVKEAMETVPLWINFTARWISSERPNTSWTSSGRQLRSSKDPLTSETGSSLLEIRPTFSWCTSCSKICTLGSMSSFHFSTSSSTRRCVPWSMSSVFWRFISSWSSPKVTKE